MSKITESLDLRPLEDFKDINLPEVINDHESTAMTEIDEYWEKAQEDYDQARDNIKDVIKLGKEVLESVKNVAMSTEQSDQYGAFTRVADLVVKSSKELINLNKEILAVKPNDPPPEPEAPEEKNVVNNITNNIVFSGTSTDFISNIRERMKSKTIEGTVND